MFSGSYKHAYELVFRSHAWLVLVCYTALRQHEVDRLIASICEFLDSDCRVLMTPGLLIIGNIAYSFLSSRYVVSQTSITGHAWARFTAYGLRHSELIR